MRAHPTRCQCEIIQQVAAFFRWDRCLQPAQVLGRDFAFAKISESGDHHPHCGVFRRDGARCHMAEFDDMWTGFHRATAPVREVIHLRRHLLAQAQQIGGAGVDLAHTHVVATGERGCHCLAGYWQLSHHSNRAATLNVDPLKERNS